MDRTPGRMFTQAASESATNTRAACCAASRSGKVLSTSTIGLSITAFVIHYRRHEALRGGRAAKDFEHGA